MVPAVAALVVVQSAAGGTGHLTMTVGGSSSYAPTNGETFTVEVAITADVPMVSWGMEPLDEADAGYTVSASVLDGTSVTNYADAGPPWTNSAGWSVAECDTKQWPAGDVNDLNGMLPGAFRPGTIAEDLGFGATSGFTLWFELTAPLAGEVSTRITLADVYAGDLNFDPLEMTYNPLVLTPEPASLSLLALGGLALLRRRR